MDALGCDAFFKLVKDGAAQWKKILKLSQALLKELDSDTAKSARGMGWDSALSRISTAARAFCMLLDPEDTNRTINDIVTVRNYKGELCFESTLKSSLTSGSFWNGIVDNILQTATGTKMAAARLQELLLMVDCAAEAVSVQDLQALVNELPDLRKNVRKGALEKIETGTRAALKHYAISILNQVSPKDGDIEKIKVLLIGLPLFETKEGVLDLLAKVKKWQAGNADFMLASELSDMLRAINTKTLGDIAAFITKVLSKERPDMTQELGDKLIGLIPQMLVCAKQEARCRAVKIIVDLVCHISKIE